MICAGYRRWKAVNVQPMISLDPSNAVFVRDGNEARRIAPFPGDCLVHWGKTGEEEELAALAAASGARKLCMEDGFVRSVGLGSDLVPPLSFVLDERGIYFDPSRPSDLEQILNTAVFSDGELADAASVRRFIVQHGITKYNIERREQPSWAAAGRRVVFVPGQVEDDASIRLGSRFVTSNIDLLRMVRVSRPDAFLVFKPHPDVQSGNRRGSIPLSELNMLVDAVETSLSAISCIEASDEVHTMTSLTGFDALLRGKQVVTYGEPFYAGWGLTEDLSPHGISFGRRLRKLNLDELVAGTLLRYPLYWDRDMRGCTTCSAVLHHIRDERNRMETSGKLESLRAGYVRRQLRKLLVLLNAMLIRP